MDDQSFRLGDRRRYPAKITMKPPEVIDGARVLEWAWSGTKPFGVVYCAITPEIYGLAITTYDDVEYYRFSCDKDWNTVQDGLYNSISEAKNQLPEQYQNIRVVWNQK